jgi:hypothetical protein
MSKIVIFVGNFQKVYLDYFIENNYTVGFFLDKNRIDSEEIYNEAITKKIQFVVPFNFENAKHFEEQLKNFYFDTNTLIICLEDKYLLATSFILRQLKLKQETNLTKEIAQTATNKIFQRKLFAEKYPEISPGYKKIRTFNAAYIFTRKYGFPVIIKPANLSQSQLVNICKDLEDLIKKVSFVLDTVGQVYKKNNVYRTPQVLIEKFIEGQQFSVDSYVDFAGKIVHTPICKQTIGKDLGLENFETVYSSYPSGLNKNQESLIFETVSKAIKSLNIKGNPTHTEVKLNSEGEKCQVIEINVRTGGYRARMLKYSYDINHVQNVINTYLGLPVVIKTKLLNCSACPQFWSDKEGILQEIKGLDKLQKLSSYKIFSQKIAIGQNVGPSALGFPKILWSVFVNKNQENLEKDIKTALQITKFKLRNNND